MRIIQHKNAIVFKWILFSAGIYHLLWALSVIFFPKYIFYHKTVESLSDTDLRFVIAAFNAALGVAYLTAMSNPLRHWRIILIGFVLKLFVVISYVYTKYTGTTEGHLIYQKLWSHQIIWLPLFAYILYCTYYYQQMLDNELIRLNHQSVDELLKVYETNKKNNLIDLSNQQPVLLVFLRHFGCTFCKEFLINLQQARPCLESKNIKIILVNMLAIESAQDALKKYKLDDLEYVSDEEQLLYKAFKLKRGTFLSFFNFKVWMRVIYLLLIKKIAVSSSEGTDVFQMPGLFILFKGKVVNQHIYKTVADNPSIEDLNAIHTT